MIELNQYYLMIALPSWMATLILLWRLRRIRESARKAALATVVVKE